MNLFILILFIIIIVFLLVVILVYDFRLKKSIEYLYAKNRRCLEFKDRICMIEYELRKYDEGIDARIILSKIRMIMSKFSNLV